MIENHHVPALPLPACAVVRQPWHSGTVGLPTSRILAEEIAVAANYDGATHAVLMMTSDDLKDFAIGFSVTEGIIRDPDEIAELEIIGHPDGIVLRMWLVGERSDALTARRRRFVGPAGCGMCGLESLAEAHRAIEPISIGDRVRPKDIARAVEALPGAQALNLRTRSVHAAAFWQVGWPLTRSRDSAVPDIGFQVEPLTHPPWSWRKQPAYQISA